MRKTRLSLVALLLMIGAIGTAWAAFVFNDPVVKEKDGITLNLAGYTAIGTLEFENDIEYSPSTFDDGNTRTSLSLDNGSDMPVIYALVKVKHYYPTGSGKKPSTPINYILDAKVDDTELAKLVTAKAELYQTTVWTDITDSVSGDVIGKEATIKVYLDWNLHPSPAGNRPTWEPKSVEDYLEIEQILQDALTAGTATVTLTVTATL